MAIRDLFKAVITADAKGIISELKNVSSASDGTADKVKKGFGSIKESVAGGVTSFVDAHPKISGALGKIGIDSQKAGSAIGTALPGAAAAGAAALGAFAAKAVASTMQLDAGILAVQRTTGATAEQASALVAIADDFNIGADALSGALGKLAKNADSKVLQEFGVQLAKNKDGTIDLYGTLTNVAEAFAATGDANERARLAQAAFGKGWQQLIPILEQGRGGLEDAYKAIGDGQIRTQEQIDASEELRLTFDALGDAAGGLSITVGNALIPVITQLSQAALSTKSALDKLPFDVVGKAASTALNPLEQLRVGIAGAGGIALAKFADWFDETPPKVEKFGGSIRAVTESTTKNAAAAREAAKAQTESEKADRGAEKAARDLAKANDDAAKAMDERAKRAFDLAFGMDAVERSEGAVTDAVLRLNDARIAQAKIAADEKATAIDIQKSNRDVEQGIYGVRDALEASATQAAEYARKQLEAAGATQSTRDKADAMIAQLDILKGKFPELGPEIDAYRERLDKIPRQVVTDVLLRTGSGPQNVGAAPLPFNTGTVVNNYFPPGTSGEDIQSGNASWQRRNGGAFNI